ncbi:MAG: NAD(P)H-dependent glycerol-3-phosphate dehydrogenase, partial [Peptostreptococcales bacterium]
MKENICVLGMGSWGTALSMSLAHKGYPVKLWGRDKDYIREVQRTRENKKYLPGAYLPKNIELCEDILDATLGSSTIILSVVSQATREILNKIKDHVSQEVLIVNTSKGLEKDNLKLASEIMAELLPQNKFIALSGPSHAEEVNKGLPTTIVAASRSKQAAEQIQELFMSPRLRVYTNPDILGVEIGGALKNIIALGAGISDGLGYGDNAKAALMTRGIVEIARLG